MPVIVLPVFCLAQESGAKTQRWSVQGEILSQTTGAYSSSIRIPGIARQLSDGKGVKAGVEYTWRKTRKIELFQDLSLMQYWHRGQENGTSAATSVGYRHFFNNVYTEGLLGAGYWHTRFSRRRTWQDENGVFYSGKFVTGSWAPSVGLGAGYHASRRWDIYVRYSHHTRLPDETHNMRHHRTLNAGVRRNL